jgi:protein kinase C substrate 80K-H
MAVLEAVRGWEYHAGLPHIGVEEDAAKEGGGEEDGEKKVEKKVEEEELEEGMWNKEDLEGRKLDGLLQTDYVGLLFEHDEFTTASTRESLRKSFSLPPPFFLFLPPLPLTFIDWRILMG